MKFEKVLFHTRFRELAFNSLESILELKQAGLKEIVLTHVLPREDVAFVPYGGYLKEEEERMREVAKARFGEWQETLSKQGIQSTIRVEIGTPNAKILDIATEENVDLIIAGRKKRTPFEKVYVGSHILDILRRSTIPVLMSKYMVQFEWEGEMLTRVNDHIFRRPILATDWSEPSENALKALVAMKGLAEKIMVLHVIDDKISKGVDAEGLKALEKKSRQRLQAYCETVAKSGLKVESHLAFGKTAPEVIRMSREHKATLITMGRTGKDWFQEYWLGGVSHRVAETSELPVLLVP